MALTISQITAASYPAVLAEMRKPANQWSENAFMAELQRQGAIKHIPFGETIEAPLDWQRNPSTDFLATDLTPTSLVKTDVLTAASYAVAELSVSVVWSKGDDAKNPTENQKVSLSKALLENGIQSHDDAIEEALFATTTDGFLGLQTIVPDTGQGTVGGISAVTETFWRNHADTYLADGSDIDAILTEAHMEASKGSGSSLAPKLMVSGAVPQALFLASQTPNQRFVNTTDLKSGFVTVAFMNARWVYSQYGGTRIYGLNPKSFKLVVSSQYFRDKGETNELDNANGFVFKIYSALQAITNNKSRLYTVNTA